MNCKSIKNKSNSIDWAFRYVTFYAEPQAQRDAWMGHRSPIKLNVFSTSRKTQDKSNVNIFAFNLKIIFLSVSKSAPYFVILNRFDSLYAGAYIGHKALSDIQTHFSLNHQSLAKILHRIKKWALFSSGHMKIACQSFACYRLRNVSAQNTRFCVKCRIHY